MVKRLLCLSLKLRLLLSISGILLCGMLLGAFFLLQNAQDAIRAELESSTELTRRFVGSALATVATNGLKVESIISTVQELRHIQITERSAQGPSSGIVVVPGVPRWFVKLLLADEDDGESRRIDIDSQGRLNNFVIKANPADEIAEVWEDARALMAIGVLLFVGISLLVYFFVIMGLRPLNELRSGFERLEAGDLDAWVSEDVTQELATIHRRFNRMSGVLRGTVDDNKRLAWRLVNLQEEERRCLARELHDEVAPYLFSIRVETDTIGKLLDGQRWDAIPPRLQAINDIAMTLQQQIRNLLSRLRPMALDEVGLRVALEDLVDGWRRRAPSVDWRLSFDEPEPLLEDTVAITVYRIVQECLTNIARHARATRASITIEVASGKSNGLRVVVEDNGQGMGTGDPRGLGLVGMRERAQALGGALDLDGSALGGLRITASIPLGDEGNILRKQ